MKTEQIINTIIFASNVFSNSEKSYECFAREFNLSKEDLIKLNKKYFIPAKKGKYNKKQLVERLSTELKTSKRNVLRNAKECGKLVKTNEEVMALIKELKKGYKVITVSNTNEFFASLDTEKEQYQQFDKAILSYKTKSLRPKLKQYKEVLKNYSVKAEECVYIDSKEKMLVPAKRLGMKTILFREFNEFKKELDKVLR